MQEINSLLSVLDQSPGCIVSSRTRSRSKCDRRIICENYNANDGLLQTTGKTKSMIDGSGWIRTGIHTSDLNHRYAIVTTKLRRIADNCVDNRLY